MTTPHTPSQLGPAWNSDSVSVPTKLKPPRLNTLLQGNSFCIEKNHTPNAWGLFKSCRGRTISPRSLRRGCSTPVQREPHILLLRQPFLPPDMCQGSPHSHTVRSTCPKAGLAPLRGSTFPILVLNILLLSPGLPYGGLNPVKLLHCLPSGCAPCGSSPNQHLSA